MLLAQLSDPHIGSESGGDPAADLAAAVAAIAALPTSPDAVLVSGDLADHGAPDEYQRVRELLAPLAQPVHVLPGNQDDRDALRAAFPLDGDPSGHYRYAVDCGGLRLVACDTLLPGRHDGALGADQLDWLEDQLRADRRTPTIVAMHHPPFPIGLPAVDDIGLQEEDRRALGELLAALPHVKRIIAGHSHVAAYGALAGCAAMTCPSAWRRRPPFDREATQHRFVEAPAGFALHALAAGELVSHVQPVIPRCPRSRPRGVAR